MSDIDLPAGGASLAEGPNRADGDSEPACCVNAGCGNRFDPSCEGWNGECDACAAQASDHFAGAHEGLELDCLLCWAEPPITNWLLVA